jgi:hypothetical protein
MRRFDVRIDVNENVDSIAKEINGNPNVTAPRQVALTNIQFGNP